MKIRVAVCTADTEYKERVASYCRKHYFDKFSWNVFSEIDQLSSFLEQQSVDVALVGREMAGQAAKLADTVQGRTVWLVLTDDDETIPDGLFKMQKYIPIDRIYRDILGAYAKKENINVPWEAGISGKMSVYAFVSASGGVGTSTLAAALAKYYAKFGKTLYLNLENIGVVELAFGSETKVGMDDLIYSLKSRRMALDLALEGAASRDKKGVYFFEVCENPMDAIRLTGEDIRKLMEALGRTGAYEKVILDVGSGVGEKEISAMSLADKIVVVLEENEISRGKFARYLKALQAIEKMKKTELCSKMSVAFNKISDGNKLPEELFQIRVADGFPRISNGTYESIIGRLSALEMISNLW